MTRNKNRVQDEPKPQYRFDRVYIRSSENENLKPDEFGLLGMEKVEGTEFYPSDHWGIKIGLKLSPNCTESVISSEDAAPCSKKPNRLDLFDDRYRILSTDNLDWEKCNDDDETEDNHKKSRKPCTLL